MKEEAADARLVALAFRRDASRKPTGGQVDIISDKRDRREKVVSQIYQKPERSISVQACILQHSHEGLVRLRLPGDGPRRPGLLPDVSLGTQQVWPLTQFFSISFL